LAFVAFGIIAGCGNGSPVDGGPSPTDSAGGNGGASGGGSSGAAGTSGRDGSAGSGGGSGGSGGGADASGTGGTGGASDGSAGLDARDAATQPDAASPPDGTARDAASAGDVRDASVDGSNGAPDASGRPDVGTTDASDAGTGGTGDAGTSDGGIVPPPGYKLVWHDEFDVDGRPNPANWKYESGFVRNEELQWYQADNARVEAGLLVIEGRRERVTNPNYQAGSSDWKTNRQYAEYTSSSLLTSGLHSWQFGRLEMLGRIVAKAGLWPAWWTLGVSGEWPSNGEVDIMEYYNGKVLANVACGTTTRWTAKWDSATKAVSSFGADWDTKFHLWRMDWDDTKIDLYLDDALMNTTNLADMLNPDGNSPFRQQHYMILNLAIGGINGGDPAATPFPTRYEVDYVRVFQKL